MRPCHLARPRLLPMAVVTLTLAFTAKLDALLRAPISGGMEFALLAPPARAADPTPAPAASSAPAQSPAVVESTAEQEAERVMLQALRARRTEIEARESAIAAREQVLAAAERRLTQRIEELAALQRRLEELERERARREEEGARALVKVYETMRPRDAASIFDELEMPVLIGILDRMREAKVAPVLAAMRPERARIVTAELARLRAERPQVR